MDVIAPNYEPSLFEGPALPRVALTGTLSRDAELRIKPVGIDRRPTLVLCIELQNVGEGGHSVHAEQIYTEATRSYAEAAAARLRQGMRVTVTSPADHLRLSLPCVESIHLNPVTQ